MKIIDAHHHIWRQADLPWLLGPSVPRIFGPYDSIKRDYLVEEFKQDIAKSGIEKSVYVQANWAPNWFEDEVSWVQKSADESGFPHGIVGYADMSADDVRPQLDKLKKYPLMRGIRQQFHWHENPLYKFAPHPDVALDPIVQKNVGHLADYGWSFDLQVFSSQMAGAAKLAEACPDVTFILQHAGMLEDLSEQGWNDWRTNLKLLAKQPNVVTKLSAFGTFIHNNDPAHIAKMIDETVKIFGAERCMFGSNFPIEKIWTSYDKLVNAFVKGASGLSQKKQTAIFYETANRVYRL